MIEFVFVQYIKFDQYGPWWEKKLMLYYAIEIWFVQSSFPKNICLEVQYFVVKRTPYCAIKLTVTIYW